MNTSKTFCLKFIPMLLAGILLFGTDRLAAQTSDPDMSGGGTLYYVAFPDTTTNLQDVRFPSTAPGKFLFYIYSPVDQQVRIGRANGASMTVTVSAGDIHEFDTKTVSAPQVTVRNIPQTNVLKVESEFPVILYAYMTTPFGCAAFTPIPVEKWGTEYYAATWTGETVRDIRTASGVSYDKGTKRPAPAQILVIAAHDNTQVTINPAGALVECQNCTRVTLDAGEAYLVESFVDTNDDIERQADIAGTSITANKRIGIVTGNSRLSHQEYSDEGLTRNSLKDLALEWVAPLEQHGMEFVFLPTWDEIRPQPNSDGTRRDQEYVRVYATSNRSTDVGFFNSLGILEPAESTKIKAGEFTHERMYRPVNGRLYKTSDPGQAFQSPESVIRSNGTTGGGNEVGAAYTSWGTYMVEMLPREEWTSFAPLAVPSYPEGMQHYVNVVADRKDIDNILFSSDGIGNRPFPFNRDTIPGTGLIWGSMPLTPGLNYSIRGMDGARFGGFVYGSRQGLEVWRPTGMEYEEEVALSYGYPLPPARCVNAEPDEYEVTIFDGCGRLEVTIEALNANPVGLSFIRLNPDSSSNAQLVFVEPESPRTLQEKKISKARVYVKPIDPSMEAHGVIEFADRSCGGQVYRILYKHEAERITITPERGIDFGNVQRDVPAGERVVTITNPMDKDVVIRRLEFRFGNQNFEITRTDPDFDRMSGMDSLVLKSGQSLKVWIDITPRDENRVYQDSLVIHFGCSGTALPLRAVTVDPCLYVNDLNFGTVEPGAKKTLPLEICNLGQGSVTFHDSTATGGGAYLTWGGTEFKVDPSDIAKLQNVQLGAGGCVTINVTFSSEVEGVARTVGRFWGNTRSCRDTSVWTARVRMTTSVREDVAGVKGYHVNSITPNPFSRDLEVAFTLGKSGLTTVRIYDAQGRMVRELLREELEAGEHRTGWDGTNAAAGIYHVRIHSGAWNVSRRVVLVR